LKFLTKLPFFIISETFKVNRRYTYEVCGEKKSIWTWDEVEAKGQRCASTYNIKKNDSFDFQCFHVLILDTPNPKVGMPNLCSATKSNISFGETLAIMLANFFSHWKVRKN
jgi:hypothetical protein